MHRPLKFGSTVVESSWGNKNAFGLSLYLTLMDLRSYYKFLAPWSTFVDFLSTLETTSYNTPQCKPGLCYREVSFGFDDAKQKASGHLQYQRHWSVKALTREQQTAELAEKTARAAPLRIDIGAEYNVEPALRWMGVDTEGYQRELCFDIDVTDYSDVRACGCGSEQHGNRMICRRCWGFIGAAAAALDYLLRATFGYQHLVWVFSGRRGIHCWVLDARTLSLSTAARRQIVDHFRSLRAGNLLLSSNAPACAVYTNILLPRFEALLAAGTLEFAQEKALLRLGQCLLPIAGSPLSKLLLSTTAETGPSRWDRCKKLLGTAHPEMLMRIVFSFVFPRLDEAVTASPEHLLRAPFSVHQETGNVCVVLQAAGHPIDNFDPTEDAPNIRLGRHIDNDRFDPWKRNFIEATLPRLSWASQLFCRLCYSNRRSQHRRVPVVTAAAELCIQPFFFGTDRDSWLDHWREEHPDTAAPSQDASTLAWLIAEESLDAKRFCEDFNLRSQLFSIFQRQLK